MQAEADLRLMNAMIGIHDPGFIHMRKLVDIAYDGNHDMWIAAHKNINKMQTNSEMATRQAEAAANRKVK